MSSSALLVLALFIAISAYNHPMADTYFFAGYAADGFLDFQRAHYTGWTGRYSSTFLLSAYPLLWGIFLPSKIGPPIVALCLGLALYGLMRVVLVPPLPKTTAACGAVVLLSVYLTHIPSPMESLYWLPSATTYTLGGGLFLALLALLWRSTRVPASPPWAVLACAVSAALAVAVCGFVETLAVLVPAVSCAGLVVTHVSGRPGRAVWASALASGIPAACVELFAAGNLHRLDFQGPASWGASVVVILKRLVSSALSWSLDPTLLALTAIAIPIAVVATHHGRQRQRALTTSFLPVVLSTAGFGGSFLAIASTQLGAADIPPRCVGFAYLLFLLGWFFGLCAAIAASRPQQLRHLRVGRWVLVAAHLVAAGSLLWNANSQLVVKDLLRRAATYDAEMRNRNAGIREAVRAGARAIVVQSPSDPPATLYSPVFDIGREPGYWTNSQHIIFYNSVWGGGVESVVRQEPSPPETS